MAEASLSAAASRPDLTLKISLAGDPGVGKTCLVRRFVSDTFDEKYVSTLGTKVSSRRFTVSDSSPSGAPRVVGAAIWDIMGSHEFRNLLKEAFFSNAGGVLLVCDVTRPESFYNLPQWYEIVASVAGPIPAVILANKSDLAESNRISPGEIEGMSREFRWPWFGTSAKSGANVEAAFQRLAEEHLQFLKPGGGPPPLGDDAADDRGRA